MANSAYQIKENISPVYASLLPEFFKQPFAREDIATCDNCIMISEDRQALGPGLRGFLYNHSTFHPDLKCCTYQPDLTNFLVGAILSTTSSELSEGRKRIKEMITNGAGVTPQDIEAPEGYSRSDNQRVDNASADSPEKACPYFDQNEKNCTIWAFRPANCSTYFCSSVEGIAGRIFWEAMNFYLSNVENQLSQYALHQLGLSSKSNLWQQDKNEFYIKTYTFIKNLDRADFAKICGVDMDILLETVQDTYAEATRTAVPKILRLNPDVQFEKLDNDQYMYNTGHGRCAVSSKLHGLLRFFDGKLDNNQVMERIVKEQNVRISADFLLRLFKNRILVSAFS